MIESGLMPPWYLSLIFRVDYNLGSLRFCQKDLITHETTVVSVFTKSVAF